MTIQRTRQKGVTLSDVTSGNRERYMINCKQFLSYKTLKKNGNFTYRKSLYSYLKRY